MRELSYNHIVHLNSILEEQELSFRIYFKDKETAELEPLDICACNGKDGYLHNVIVNYLKKDGFLVTFSEDGKSFSVKEKRLEVVAAVITVENKIFATQRGYGEFKGGWEFPGGKIEQGETPQEALIREIKEELDTEIVVGDLIDIVEYDYPQFHLTMRCFVCKVRSGNLVLKEHEAARWLTKEQLDSVKWLPADKGLVEKLQKK